MVDLLVDGEPRGAGAPLPPPSGRFGRDRWRAYFNYLRRQPADARERLKRRWTHLGRQWNAAHNGDHRLERVRLFRVSTADRPGVRPPEPSGRMTRVHELLAVAVGSSQRR